jgi:hypothetical protein
VEPNKRNQQISREAAAIAIKWKSWFAIELQQSAERSAVDSDTVTVEHFRQAIPDALNAFTQRVKAETLPSHARRKTA